MSFQWKLIAGYVYFEIAVVILMVVPLFSPRKWHQFFKSRLFATLQLHVAVHFYMFLGLLVVFLIDTIRDMSKYSYVTIIQDELNLKVEQINKETEAALNLAKSKVQSQLEHMEKRLNDEKTKAQQLAKEVKKWKSKFGVSNIMVD